MHHSYNRTVIFVMFALFVALSPGQLAGQSAPRRPSQRLAPFPAAFEAVRLTPPDGEPGDCFGSKVAVHYDTIVAGAPWDTHDQGPENAGSAYIFTGFGTDWHLQQKLVAFDAALEDNFGYSVAIWGNTIAVGAEHDDHSGIENAGAVYLYEKRGATWIFVQKITAGDPRSEAHFGHSISLDNDTLAVGTWRKNRVYIFNRYGTTWYQDQKLTQSMPDGGNFGQSVALSDDLLVIGADRFSGNDVASSGAAYIYKPTLSQWILSQRITASDPGPHDLFGYSVGVFGDLIVVGARYDDIGEALDAGSAYVYALIDGRWSQIQKLEACNAGPGNQFGSTVAIWEGLLMVGAPFSRLPNGVRYGCSHVFSPSDGVWAELCALIASNPTDNSRLGVVAAHDQISVLGAPFAPLGCTEIGAVYVFYRPEFTSTSTLVVSPRNLQSR